MTPPQALQSPAPAPIPPLGRSDLLALLKAFKRDCADRYEILELGVFGSFARGTASATSDVDVCVKTRMANPFQLVHIKAAIEERVGRPVDLVRVRERMSPLLKERIAREAIYL